MSIDIESLDDANEQRNDFRRANGAPLVSRVDDPDKSDRYSRPSGYGKNLDDENALVEWRIWKAMTGVAHSRALAAKVNATKDEDRVAKKALRDEAMDKGEANESADMGTALHAMTARVEDDGDDFEPPPQYVLDLDAYQDTLRRFGLDSAYVECHMVNDEFRAAGTADRIYRCLRPLQPPEGDVIPAGSLVLGDIKTGKSLDFSAPGYCIQTALYATGVFYDIVTERRIETPKINQLWTLLVHLPVGRGHCELYWCSVTLGLQGAWLAHEVKQWQRLWKNGTHDIPRATEPETATEIVERLLPGAETVMTADLVPEMVKYCQRRLAAIAGVADARRDLLLAWPKDLAPPNKITEPIEVVRLLNLLDTVEAKHSLPFLPDPREGTQAGLHKSKVDRSNEFLLVN